MGPLYKGSLIAAAMLTAVCVSLSVVVAGEIVPLLWVSPTSDRLNSVFMVSSSEGWAVGDEGTIIRWNGADWSNSTSPTDMALISVFMVGSDDGWAVGSLGTIVRWNGSH
jgi:photosystem II stability/assembly factor-like uncharacterized protein